MAGRDIQKNRDAGRESPDETKPEREGAVEAAFPQDTAHGAARLLAAGFNLRPTAGYGAASAVPEPLPTSAAYTLADRVGSWKARWGINRMQYMVKPGLYRLGQPDAEAPVLVTANYKMSFDTLRRELQGRNLWILVLDTKGINVWCAAGKGTFGTSEIVRRIQQTALAQYVSHRRLILPQLGAPGVSAREVRRQSGFQVSYGPVRAEDVPAFLDHSDVATEPMRRVRFRLVDRLVLTPMEIVSAVKPLLLACGTLFLLNATGLTRFGGFEVSVLVAGILSGAVLVPVLLPWIPGRAFSLKGLIVGVLLSILVLTAFGFRPVTASLFPDEAGPGWVLAGSGSLVVLAIASYLAMNFTGCSTYTSPSGVRKEMRWAVPLQAALVVLGGLGILLARLLQR